MRARHRGFLLPLLCAVTLAAAAGVACADPLSDAMDAARRGDVRAALAASEAGVAAAPKVALAWSVRGYVLSFAGRKQEAFEAYGKAIALDPADVRSRLNQGSVLLALGRAEEALAAFEGAAKADPARGRAQNHRGVALERLGRLDEARAAYRRAIAMDAADAVARTNLGALAFRRGSEKAAAEHFARALELDPRLDEARINAALMLAATGDGTAGEAEVLAAAQRPGASADVVRRAKAIRGAHAARERRWADAKALYLEVLEGDPDDPAVLNNLGVAEDQLGETREALEHLTTALEVRGGDPVLENNVGVVHVHRGDLDAAKRIFERVVSIDPRFHRAHHNLGVVLGAMGDRTGAVAAFRRASALAPDDASSLYNLAVLAHERGGDAADERASLERALALDGTLAEAHLALGTLLADPATPAHLRDEAKARTHLRTFLDLAFRDDVVGRRQATDWIAWLDAAARSR